MDGGPSERWDEDPGWNLSCRNVLGLIPPLPLIRLRRGSGDPLVNLRRAYLAYPVSLLIFGDVLRGLLPFRGDSSAVLWAVGISVLAVVYFFVVRRTERPFRCESEQGLAAAYRARMFLRIAFATSTALFGFCAAFITNASWVFLPCVACSLPGLFRAAPTRAPLIRDQDELTARGCTLSLVAALRQVPPK